MRCPARLANLATLVRSTASVASRAH
jgi:hypothetical protein